MSAPSPLLDSAPTPTLDSANGRDANGRFVPGNPGGPGNPYYRRQTQLKRQLLASVTDADIQAVMQTLMGLARGGDLAAIKLFLEYTVGKPNKEVDPDKEELHEWQLQQQTPRLQQVLEVSANGIDTPRANQVVRELVPLVGDCHLQTVSQQIAAAQEAPPTADSNGNKRPSASARRMAAGVPSTVPTVDNGEQASSAEPELELARAYFAGEIGIEAVTRYYREAGMVPSQPGNPGFE